jgi:hypothetical protein
VSPCLPLVLVNVSTRGWAVLACGCREAERSMGGEHGSIGEGSRGTLAEGAWIQMEEG